MFPLYKYLIYKKVAKSNLLINSYFSVPKSWRYNVCIGLAVLFCGIWPISLKRCEIFVVSNKYFFYFTCIRIFNSAEETSVFVW